MTKSFTILTQSGFRYDRLKRFCFRLGAKVLGRKIYGPNSVCDSLLRGLEHLKKDGERIQCNINPSIVDMYDTVVVLMHADTLRYAIKLKKQWKIKTLLAGPAISVPLDHKDIFFDTHIDTILVPSQRVKDYFLSLKPYNPERIVVWPAGVADTGLSKKEKKQILIYKKTCPEELYNRVCVLLDQKGISYKTVVYGSFLFHDYVQLLDQSIGMIYLQESESQGLALQNAWIKDIATLVWDRGYRTYQGLNRHASQISCPYLSPDCGLTFDEDSLEPQLDKFMTRLDSYHPRRYCLQNLSDVVTTKLLLNYL